MKVCIITTGQPAVNPRVVKEADILQANGCEVTLLYCFWIQWAMDSDKQLLKKVKWNFRCIGGTPATNKPLYYYTKIRFKICRRLYKISGNRFLLAERSQARCFDELLRAAKAVKADWYIGHNLGALAVAVQAASANSAKAGFDFEDYHREEDTQMTGGEKRKIVFLEEKYVPQLSYFSTASSLITKRIRQNFTSFYNPVITLLNCFSLSQQPKLTCKVDADDSLKLFWFSQTVGLNRGLETVLNAINILQDDTIQLWLVGKSSHEIQDDFKQRAGNMQKNIHFIGVVEPDEIFAIASAMDIGLALEQKQPLNRDICLTNKIFTYLLSGNAIILSDTSMQKSFEKDNKVGTLFPANDAEALAEKILFLKNRDRLNSQRLHNYELAKETFNWENESKKLLAIIKPKTIN